MSAIPGLVIFSMLAAAASPAQAPSLPLGAKPAIPAALHGCWEANEPESEEHRAFSQTVIVSADKVVIESDGVGRREGGVELVERLGPNLIEGRISAIEGGMPITLATTLERDPKEDMLLLREGDAGSYVLTRCSAAKAPGERLSLVIAETGRQDDPQPAPCAPDGSCGDSFFRAEFRGAHLVAGASLPSAFDARLRLHTPLITRSTLALIVEHRPDGSLLVLRRAGFNGRTGIACFREPDEHPVAWTPLGPQIRWEKDILCVSDPSQIDPNAPRD
jgi:hypothetical protein